MRAKLRPSAFCFAELWECVRVLAPLFGALLRPSNVRVCHSTTRALCASVKLSADHNRLQVVLVLWFMLLLVL